MKPARFEKLKHYLGRPIILKLRGDWVEEFEAAQDYYRAATELKPNSGTAWNYTLGCIE